MQIDRLLLAERLMNVIREDKEKLRKREDINQALFLCIFFSRLLLSKWYFSRYGEKVSFKRQKLHENPLKKVVPK